MKKCPYCLAEIDPMARKCQHCGEWVSAPKEQTQSGISKAELDQSLKTVNFIAQWKIIGAVISIPIVIVFLIAFASTGPGSKQRSGPKRFEDTFGYQLIRESEVEQLPSAIEEFRTKNNRDPNNSGELKEYILENNQTIKTSDLDSMSLVESPDGMLSLKFKK